jgi:hypothetical protein
VVPVVVEMEEPQATVQPELLTEVVAEAVVAAAWQAAEQAALALSSSAT